MRQQITFSEALQTYPIIVENGPLGTRLKYEYGFSNTFELLESKQGRAALTELYKGDVDIAQETRVPIIMNAATFRASRNHLRSAGFNAINDVKRINMDYINFVKQLRDSYVNPLAPIFVGAPLGSMYDAYSIDTIPSVEEAKTYHEEQIAIFKEAGVDFINVVTLSSISEALGISLAAEKSGLPYTIGFILNKKTMLLDGTPLHQAIQMIDARTTTKPLGYLITCTHTSVIEKLLMHNSPNEYKRLIGIQPNGSSLTPKELASLDKPATDTPQVFSAAVIELQNKLHVKIVAGCCGTGREHLQEILKAYKKTLIMHSRL